MAENRSVTEQDAILVGAGIVSSTLGVLLKELESRVTGWARRRVMVQPGGPRSE